MSTASPSLKDRPPFLFTLSKVKALCKQNDLVKITTVNIILNTIQVLQVLNDEEKDILYIPYLPLDLFSVSSNPCKNPHLSPSQHDSSLRNSPSLLAVYPNQNKFLSFLWFLSVGKFFYHLLHWLYSRITQH